MGTGAVQITVDGMAGPMHEVLAISGRANHPARRIIERGADHRLALAPPLLEDTHCRVPCVTYRFPDLPLFRPGVAARVCHPCLIGKDRTLLGPRPQVEQDHVTLGETAIRAGAWLVMRIRGIGLKTDDRRMVGEERCASERVHHTR